MNRVPPIGAGEPDPLDLDAAEELQRNESDRLRLVRARAEKWIGVIGALTAVLTGALVIKGPQDAGKLEVGWRVAAAVALGLAIVLLAVATYRAYQAAFGAPSALEELSAIPLTGLHRRLIAARQAAAAAALHDLSSGVRAAFAAVALIAAAVAITWFAPATESTPQRSICLYVHGQIVARLAGSTVSLRALSPGTTIKPCT
jgi:hypothetical protein